jgi:cytochrome P450
MSSTSIDYRPFSPAVVADPYPWYERLRAESPIHHDAYDDLWVISRYDDVLHVLRDPATFSSAAGMGDLLVGGYLGRRRAPEFVLDLAGMRLLIASDPPDHTVLRRLVSKAFTPREIMALEPRIRALTEAMVDDLIDAGDAADLVTQLAYPLPVIVIAELLGIPGERRDDFKRWSDDLVGALSGTWDPSRGQFSGLEMFMYFSEVVAERTRNPGDDLISLLVSRGRDGEAALDPMEIVLFCALLLIAGNETTTNLIGNGAQALFDHPDQARRLRDDPSLVPAAVEEALRYDAPVQALFRATTAAVRIGDVEIPEHARVMVLFASANRDEAHFPTADRFVVDRAPNDHLGFGSGIHLCIGAPLARLEARIVAETMLRRVRRLEPAGEPCRVESFILRGFTSLPVQAVPAGS